MDIFWQEARAYERIPTALCRQHSNDLRVNWHPYWKSTCVFWERYLYWWSVLRHNSSKNKSRWNAHWTCEILTTSTASSQTQTGYLQTKRHPNTRPAAWYSGIIETGLSDHSLVFAVYNNKLMCPKAESFSKRNFKNFDQEAFLRNFNSVPFSVAYLFKDPDHEKITS